MTEIWNLSTLCRCCHSDGLFKGLNQPYESTGGVDIYEVLLLEILGIMISQPKIEASYTICDTCITRLKDAAQFKEQILDCERKFQVYCTNEEFLSGVLIENLKTEVNCQNSDNESTGIHEDLTEGDDIDPCNENKTVKKEEVTIEVGFNNAVEDLKTDIKLKVNNENNKYEAEIKASDKVRVKAGQDKRTPAKKIKKPFFENKNTSVKQKKLEPKRVSTDGSKQWQRQKVRLKLLHSFIVQIKTKTGMSYSCKICAGSYKNKSEILKHIRLQHTSRYKCEQCGKPFPHEYTLRRHMKNIHGNELYECCHCKRTFTCKSNLKVHENSHTKQRVFKCDECGKTFLYKGTLRKHIAQIHAKYTAYKKFICDMCGLSFYDRTNLGMHIRTVHLKQRPFACNICGKTYTAKKHVKSHMKIHSEDPKPYHCEDCPKKFACIKSYRNHKINQHSDGTMFACRYCPNIFDSKKDRDLHYRVHGHSVLNPLTCHICGKTLMTRFTLNRHIEIHNGVKRYGCEICGVKFTQKSLLVRHCKRKHDPTVITEKVKCLQCKKMVRNIERHMATHNEEKRFFCDICGKSYAENNALTRHKNHAHFGISYDCVYCGKKYINKRSLASHEIKLHKIKRENVENIDEIKKADLESK